VSIPEHTLHIPDSKAGPTRFDPLDKLAAAEAQGQRITAWPCRVSWIGMASPLHRTIRRVASAKPRPVPQQNDTLLHEIMDGGQQAALPCLGGGCSWSCSRDLELGGSHPRLGWPGLAGWPGHLARWYFFSLSLFCPARLRMHVSTRIYKPHSLVKGSPRYLSRNHYRTCICICIPIACLPNSRTSIAPSPHCPAVAARCSLLGDYIALSSSGSSSSSVNKLTSCGNKQVDS
jgi:hypothetical protein